MKFTTPALVEEVIWNLKFADQPRGYKRSLVDRLFNGQPPMMPDEHAADPDSTNVNFLKAPILASDARRSYYNGFIKPGLFFHASTDYGDPMKRSEWGTTFTNGINHYMKRNRRYFEFMRSQFALTVLHGIGPGFWYDRDHWVPECLGVEDVLIPGNTLLSMQNLDHFAVYRQYTAMQLYGMTHGHKVDPAWNMPVVEAALKWVNEQTTSQLSYTDAYMPQKTEERMKQDMGILGTDISPTVDCWDFYYWSDEGKEEGWRRCMVLETPAYAYSPATESTRSRKMPTTNKVGLDLGKNGNWLYKPDGRKRIYAPSLDNILHFQFGDLNATAPFRYHSTRSLGWLLYSVCHLDNRLRCRMTDAIMESMLQYFRLSNANDKERVTKIDLHDKGVIPEGVDFVKAQDRWKIDPAAIQLGLGENRAMIMDAAAQYRENPHGTEGQGRERVTATEIMAEINRANALVGGMLLQAYEYARFQYQEILRRFCKKDSKDRDVKAFRAEMLTAGLPEKILEPDCWEVEPERVLGQGNKMLQIAIADKLMAVRPNLDPESQREIDHIYVLANSDDPALADRLVPVSSPRKSESVHVAKDMVGSLMQGVPYTPEKGQNPIEMIQTLLRSMAMIVQRIQRTGPPSQAELIGLGNIASTVTAYLKQLSQNKAEQEKAALYTEQLSQLLKVIGVMAKASQKQAQGGNGGPDPKEAAKAQAMVIQARTKAALQARSHAQRTQERDVSAQMKLRQDAERHELEMTKERQRMQLDATAKDLETAGNIRRNRLKSVEE